jgi:hypothetical protein
MQILYTTVDGINVVVTKPKWLSTTNATRLSFSLPFNMAEVRNVSDSAQLFSLRVFNAKGSLSVVQVFDVQVDATWYMETTPT